MKMLFFFLFCIIGLEGCAETTQMTCVEEEMSFTNRSGFKIKGSLLLPKDFRRKNKLVILIAPPIKADRNYFGLFKFIGDSLCKQGIVVCKFDNRSFIYKGISENTLTMQDQAADAHDVFEFLKQDVRFKNTSIGLLGHSEGGDAAAIEASKNKNIGFLILLSAIGLDGKTHSINQIKSQKEWLRKMGGDTSAIEKAFLEKIKKIEITSLNISPDSMARIFKKDMVEKFQKDSTSFKRLSLEQQYKRDSVAWLNKHRLSYTNFDPEVYFTKIECPTLIISGDLDELVQYDINLRAIEIIFKNANKTNFNIEVLKNVNHNYEQLASLNELVPPLALIQQKKRENVKFANTLIPVILEWNALQ